MFFQTIRTLKKYAGQLAKCYVLKTCYEYILVHKDCYETFLICIVINDAVSNSDYTWWYWKVPGLLFLLLPR
jgi:hypothetical protein